jgi:hypothetical protein
VTQGVKSTIIVRHYGEHWYVYAVGSRAEEIPVVWMSSTRAESVAVERWLARGLAPSELLIHRRDDQLLRAALERAAPALIGWPPDLGAT